MVNFEKRSTHLSGKEST